MGCQNSKSVKTGSAPPPKCTEPRNQKVTESVPSVSVTKNETKLASNNMHKARTKSNLENGSLFLVDDLTTPTSFPTIKGGLTVDPGQEDIDSRNNLFVPEEDYASTHIDFDSRPTHKVVSMTLISDDIPQLPQQVVRVKSQDSVSNTKDSSDSKSQVHSAILPSAGVHNPCGPGAPTCVDGKDLKALFRLVCGATNNNNFGDCAMKNLHFYRASCLTANFQEALLRLTTSVDTLIQLDLSGSNAGPVAVRALLQTLAHCDVVEELNLSDNKADSNCTSLLKQVLILCKVLTNLDVSGNQLGKESLSLCLSDGLALNNTLVKLNLSSCGASNLHGLFEGLLAALAAGQSVLKHLDISNNDSNDGQQLGLDVSSVLQNPNCKIIYLNVENTGLNPSGFNAVINGVRMNQSLKELCAGGSSNRLQSIFNIPELIFSSTFLSALDLKSILFEEKPIQDNLFVIVDDQQHEYSMMKLNLAHCCLTDALILAMERAYPEKLPNLSWLNLSNNSDLTVKGICAFKVLASSNGNCYMNSLFVSGNFLENITDILSGSFAELTVLSLSKARIATSELKKIADLCQELRELILDGIKIGQTNLLATLLKPSAGYRLTKLSLHGCGLTNQDLMPLVTAVIEKSPAVESLTWLDISANRICEALQKLSTALQTTSHPLEYLNVSYNGVTDDSARALANYISSAHSHSKLKTLIISHNNLCKRGLLALMNIVASRPIGPGLVSLDASSQKNGLNEDELENVVEALAAALGLNPERAEHDGEEQIPLLSSKFNVNLTDLGGAPGVLAKRMDSVAIKTDFAKIRNPLPSLNDYLIISAGLSRSRACSSSLASDVPMFTSEEWTAIIGPEAPAWLKLDSERKKGIYVSHLPGTATMQRLQGILEMEADCSVSEVVFIKDAALLKQSGAAWVLFDDERSVELAVEWYAQGEAQIFGAPFCISAIKATVADFDDSVKLTSEKEKRARKNERKHKEDSDRSMLEASQQLADERAAYREAHPAYQNGRIW